MQPNTPPPPPPLNTSSSPVISVLRCTQCLCTMRVNTKTIEQALDSMSQSITQASSTLLPTAASFVLVPPTTKLDPSSPPTIPPLALEQLHLLMTRISEAACLNNASVPKIQYPMCTACAHALDALLIRYQTELEEERLHYQTLIKDFEQNSDVIDSPREMQALEEEEQNLLIQLASLELEEHQMDIQDAQFAQDEMDAFANEQAFYLHVNQFQATLKQYCLERESLNKRVSLASKHLDQLRSTNVVNDVFRIGQVGPYPTIDGLRFGKIPSDQKEWHEVNAAWGQACLMLHTLACRLKFEFHGYRLLPMGSTSKIQKLSLNNTAQSSDTSTNASSTTSSSVFTSTTSSPTLIPNIPPRPENGSAVLSVQTTYDLHGSGSDLTTKLTRFLLTNSAFDKGLGAFLICLAQLCAYCQSIDPSFAVPYKIANGCIGDVPIRMHKGPRNTNETWTRACKFVLTNLKWIMAFATKRVSAKTADGNKNPLCD